MMKKKKDISFLKKVIMSIKDFEKYPMLASKDWSVVLAYLLKLLAIFTLIGTCSIMFTIFKEATNTEEASQVGILINNLTRQISENYSETNQVFIYIGVFAISYLYMFVINIISIAIDIILLGAFGYFTAIIIRLHLKFSAMCKIALHSLTLPIILNMVYILIKTFTNFEIKYFELMYISIAYIYIVTAILMIKYDVMKNQQELNKIIQEQEKVRQEMERKKKEEEEKERKEREEREEKDRKDNKKNDEKDKQENQNDEEPEGENA